MTTEISRAQFLQALKDHPEWREEIRKEILGEELLRLPSEFRAFVARQEEFNAQALRRFDNIDRRMDRMEGDNSTLKSQNLEQRADEFALLLCLELDCNFVRRLNLEDLIMMAKDAVPSLMGQDERRSFVSADLVVGAEHNGATLYIAAEISYTGALRDYQRAKRNSEYITEISGQPAVPAIISVRNDKEVQDLINDGAIHWCPVKD